jgi:hypothetical protein
MLREMRTCLKCNKEKPDEMFGVDKSRKDNRHPYCRECRSIFETKQEKEGKRKRVRKPVSKEKKAEYIRRCRYRLDNEKYSEMVSKQDNKCAICSKEMSPPHIDHNHTTGEVRGLLCKSCNASLGLMKDSVELLEKAIVYLKDTDSCHNAKTHK